MENGEVSAVNGIDISNGDEGNAYKINNTEMEEKAVANNDVYEFEDKWGFPLEILYKLATKFQKEKEGKALHLSYPEKLQLVARTQQISLGPLDPNIAPPVGYLDVIGRDRRQAWQSLGNQSKEKSILEYIDILDKACHLFRPYVEAHKKDLEEKERIKREKELQLRREEEEREQKRLEEEILLKEQQEQRRLELQKQQIQDALNQQTYFQFKAYVEQQLPGNPEQQAILMRQLQEQHYQQYMQQVYQQQQSLQSLQQSQQPQSQSPNVSQDEARRENKRAVDNSDGSSNGSSSGDEQSNDLMVMVKPASMWTRKDVVEFKTSIVKEGGDSVIKVGHGETVTVRVPTHEDGTCLYWEFATDNYDIGFGVYFEWTKSPGTQVSVHISESEDEDDDEVEEVSVNAKVDVEKGVAADKTDAADRPPLTVIIPVYRRDCHEEVYAGSHPYPGQGAYLLKFDNSYSLWRSKTLYYRVYYTH
ncbi:Golgi resident protein GCP60 [Chamberlinius hualienensis]